MTSFQDVGGRNQRIPLRLFRRASLQVRACARPCFLLNEQDGAQTGATTMTQPTEKEIMARAYEIWERNGRPEGREEEFWHQAEQELRNEDKSSPLRTPDTL